MMKKTFTSEFQFLLGRLETRLQAEFGERVCPFQFLLGRLETYWGRLRKACHMGFNSSCRLETLARLQWRQTAGFNSLVGGDLSPQGGR